MFVFVLVDVFQLFGLQKQRGRSDNGWNPSLYLYKEMVIAAFLSLYEMVTCF
jgi:hypothetical protein